MASWAETPHGSPMSFLSTAIIIITIIIITIIIITIIIIINVCRKNFKKRVKIYLRHKRIQMRSSRLLNPKNVSSKLE